MKNATKELNDFSNLFFKKDLTELSAIELKELSKHEYHLVNNFLLNK